MGYQGYIEIDFLEILFQKRLTIKIKRCIDEEMADRKTKHAHQKILIFLLIMIVPVLYCLYSNIQYERLIRNKAQEENCVYESNGISLFVISKDPIMSFGSGNKKMYLFSKNHFLIGECTFGEFPLRIEAIDVSKRIIFVTIKSSYDGSNKDYIESWVQKNKTIGKYIILYEYD